MTGEPNPESRGPAESARAKAESWLSFIANRIEEFWDQEALVYLRSRGFDCDEPIAKLIESWKAAEKAELEEYKKRDPQADASDIADVPAILLRDFWGGFPLEDHAGEAAMLRTVEWCEIRGFDRWWQRLASIHRERLLYGGVPNPVPASYWLFSMLRSDYALELMPGVLDRCLEAISLPGPSNSPPWLLVRTGSADLEEHLPYASAIIFGCHRLTSSQRKLVHPAVETICRHQDKNGSWPTWTGKTGVSIESTAMALHALALEQPRGWERMAARAQNWLWSVQGKDGFWEEAGSPGPVYLTVLVLDAIALANDEPSLTFRRPVSPQTTSASPEQPGKTFSDLRPRPDSAVPGEGVRGTPEISDASGAAQPGITKVDPAAEDIPLATAQQRRAAVDAYIDEVFKEKGLRLTRKDIWTSARYKTPTEFERWQRKDLRATTTATERFTRILKEKPHLKAK